MKKFTVTEQLNNSLFSDKELAALLRTDVEAIPTLRNEWVTNFIKQGGINLLLQILNDLNTIAQSKPKGEVLKSKIDKECWNHVLKILKVLLMSTFIAKLPSNELSSALERRMSESPALEEEKKDSPASITEEKKS